MTTPTCCDGRWAPSAGWRRSSGCEQAVRGDGRPRHHRRAGRRHLHPDRGLRELRVRREPRDQLRAAGLRLVLAEAALPGRLPGRPAARPADGLLLPAVAGRRRPAARRTRAPARHRRLRGGRRAGAAGSGDRPDGPRWLPGPRPGPGGPVLPVGAGPHAGAPAGRELRRPARPDRGAGHRRGPGRARRAGAGADEPFRSHERRGPPDRHDRRRRPRRWPPPEPSTASGCPAVRRCGTPVTPTAPRPCPARRSTLHRPRCPG